MNKTNADKQRAKASKLLYGAVLFFIGTLCAIDAIAKGII